MLDSSMNVGLIDATTFDDEDHTQLDSSLTIGIFVHKKTHANLKDINLLLSSTTIT